MSPLCPYKNIFGAPNTGVHATRLFGIAIYDFIMTIVAGVVLAWAMKWNVAYTIVGLFVIGILAHRMFCVRTTVDRILFPNA